MIGERLAELRKLNGEKQQVLAKALSVSVSTVRSWEHDKSSPDHSTLVAICRRYHTSSDFLLGLSDYDPSDKARLQRQRLTEEAQNEVHRYEVQAMLDSSLRDHLLECLAFTAEARKDTAQYLHYLTQAWEDYPTRQPFFLRLTDYYLQQHDYARVLTLCDRQLEVDTLRTAAYVARCNALLNLRRFDEVVATAKQLQQCDTLCAEAYYYMGTADAALGAMVTLPKDARSAAYKQAHKKQQTYYRKAMESIEEYRRRMPDDKARWAPLLYQLYLWLNEGKKFEEVERLLQ